MSAFRFANKETELMSGVLLRVRKTKANAKTNELIRGNGKRNVKNSW